jgi:hypothetical protein
MGLALASQTWEPTAEPPNLMARALREPIGSSGAMSWGHHCPTYEERGQSRRRLGWRRLFGCCVFVWLSCGCIWLTLATSYYPSRGSGATCGVRGFSKKKTADPATHAGCGQWRLIPNTAEDRTTWVEGTLDEAKKGGGLWSVNLARFKAQVAGPA